MASERVYKAIDLKPYQPFGIPILKLMASLIALSMAMVVVYEYLL